MRDYTLDIGLDNITKIQLFDSVVRDEVEEPVYLDDTNIEESEKTTTLLLHLERPATFFYKQGLRQQTKRCLSPFNLP
jgi:hypothetical protein